VIRGRERDCRQEIRGQARRGGTRSTQRVDSQRQAFRPAADEGTRKDGERVTLYSRPGNDFTRRFPPIARALTHLRCRSCIIDGEAVICDDNGIASFNYIRYRRNDGDVFLYAFDLIVLLERWGGKLLERRVDEGA
jgi:ATP dependent DNA ligase domain